MSVYNVADGVRNVNPYLFEFKTFAKGRWIGKCLLDVVCSEFGGLGYDKTFWSYVIRNGHININGNIVPETYIMKNSDHLSRKTHRHEPPVYGQVQFVGENETMFAVCKPASMPMHACGAYHYNSLSMVIEEEFKQLTGGIQLLQIHRYFFY